MRNPKTREELCVGCNKNRNDAEAAAAQQQAAQAAAAAEYSSPPSTTAAADTEFAGSSSSDASKQAGQTLNLKQQQQRVAPAVADSAALAIRPASSTPAPHLSSMNGSVAEATKGFVARAQERQLSRGAAGGVDAAELLANVMVKGWTLLDTTCPR